MYSKYQPPPGRPTPPREPSYRRTADRPVQSPAERPAGDRPLVQVPPGYRGHAVADARYAPPPDGEARSDTPAGGKQGDLTGLQDAGLEGVLRKGLAVPRFDDLPRVSELGGHSLHNAVGSPAFPPGARSGDHAAPQSDSAPHWEFDYEDGRPFDAPPGAPLAVAQPEVAPSPDRPRHAVFDAGHFPFGHGLGFDEILILGLILLLLRENEPDSADRGDLDETLLLLGLLLFLG